ncbi:MAG: hypothetical protein WBA76_20620 [Phormidesmis sp.]
MLKSNELSMAVADSVGMRTQLAPTSELIESVSLQYHLKRKDRRSLEKTLGDDPKRLTALEYALHLCGVFHSELETPHWWGNIEALLNISKVDAYRTIYHLPKPVVLQSKLTEEEQIAEQGFYIGISLWLVSREINQSTAIAGTLKSLGFDSYQVYATASDTRFKLIQRLCEIKAEAMEHSPNSDYPFKSLPFKKPGIVWLLTESASCQRRHRNANTGKVTSKDDCYKGMKVYLDDLEKDPSVSQSKGWAETLEKFSECVDGEAAAVAAKDPEFKKQFLTPYTNSLRVWNSRSRTLTALGLQKVKPGTKLGQKQSKYRKQEY